jgi:moderate conductance mechanosensitive channel
MDLQHVLDWIANYGLAIPITIVVAYVLLRFSVLIIGGIVRKTMVHGGGTKEDIRKRQDTIISLLSVVLRVVVWVVAGLTLAINALPFLNLSPIIVSAAGVMGVAIGFGAQGLVRDFISGLYIIIENQYRVGDVVQIDNFTGKVVGFTIRSTVLRDDNGALHHITNGTVNHAINKTMGQAKLNLVFTVPIVTDVDKLIKTVNAVGLKFTANDQWKHKIQEPPYFKALGDQTIDSLNFTVTGKVQASAQWEIADELRKALLEELKKAAILPSKN